MIRRLQNLKIQSPLTQKQLRLLQMPVLRQVQTSQLVQKDVAIKIGQVAALRALTKSNFFLINLVFGLPQQYGGLFFWKMITFAKN